MATWMVHLRIAERLLERWPELDAAAFAVGSLAPDSGIPNASGTAYDPPKEVTHFKAPDRQGIVLYADLVFCRRYLNRAEARPGSAETSFLLGYFYHLICDRLWVLRVYQPSVQHSLASFSGDRPAAIKAIKRDWEDLDLLYARCHPQSLFWRVFLSAPPWSHLPFIPSAALARQQEEARRYYGDPEPRELDRPFPFLNERTVTRFVEDCTAAALKIHDDLRDGGLPTGATALALLGEGEVAPYEPPLGDEERRGP